MPVEPELAGRRVAIGALWLSVAGLLLSACCVGVVPALVGTIMGCHAWRFANPRARRTATIAVALGWLGLTVGAVMTWHWVHAPTIGGQPPGCWVLPCDPAGPELSSS
jgi:hypothetical protein